jgi:hypothetical protein
MTNQEKKHQLWESLLTKFKHLENYCKIEVRGLDEDSVYFHPVFVLDEKTKITSQGDTKNRYIYALNFGIQTDYEYFNIELSDDLLDNVVIGYHTNKEVVLLALSTLDKVRKHINQLNMFTTDYVNNILIGNSITDVTDSFVNELKATNAIVSFMQKTIK